MYPNEEEIKLRIEFIDKEIKTLEEEKTETLELANLESIDECIKALYFERDSVLHNIRQLRSMLI